MSPSNDELLPVGASTPRRRGPFIAVAVVAAVLVIAALVWNAAGHDSPTSAPSRPSAAPSIGPTPDGSTGMLADNGNRCSAQQGGQLMLGIQLTNGAASRVDISRVDVELPLGMLRLVSVHASECVRASDELAPFTMEPGEQAWVSAILDVLVACPAPAPVQFAVEYTWRQSGQVATLAGTGFSDLGDVRYTGCATPAP